MPTEILHSLRVEGPAELLERFRMDAEAWEVEPWRSMFGPPELKVGPGYLTYRYNDDFKRPSPSVSGLAELHPLLKFIHEYADEFCSSAGRQRFEHGTSIERHRVSPYALHWIEWSAEDGE